MINHVAAAAVGGKFYLIGGQLNQEEAQISLSIVEMYDPVTDQWTSKQSIPQTRSHVTSGMFVHNGRIVSVGGESAFNTVKTELFAYDPVLNAWSIMGYLPSGRSTVVAGILPDGRIISSTGNTPTFSATTWIGTPK